MLTNSHNRDIIYKSRGVAQFGDVYERRRWRKKRVKRSGSDLLIGKLQSNADRGKGKQGERLGSRTKRSGVRITSLRPVGSTGNSVLLFYLSHEAQFGDVYERRRRRKKRVKRSGISSVYNRFRYVHSIFCLCLLFLYSTATKYCESVSGLSFIPLSIHHLTVSTKVAET